MTLRSTPLGSAHDHEGQDSSRSKAVESRWEQDFWNRMHGCDAAFSAYSPMTSSFARPTNLVVVVVVVEHQNHCCALTSYALPTPCIRWFGLINY